MKPKGTKPSAFYTAILLACAWMLIPFFAPRCFHAPKPRIMFIKVFAFLLLCFSAVAADNVRLIKVPSRPPPPASGCVTNVVISGILGAPATYAFTYGGSCVYTPLGVNYQVGGCSLSSACTNLSANSIIVSNAQSATIATVTIQTRNGIYPTNLVLGSGFTGAQFYWGLSCNIACTNCAPFVCRVHDTGGGN